MSRSPFAILLVLAAVGTATASPEGAWRHDRSREDFRELGRHRDFAAVGRLVIDGSAEKGGSGTLVAPGWVLTAAHVVDRWKSGSDWVWEWDGKAVPIARVILHPGFRAATLQERVDVALVRLDGSPDGVEPIRLTPPVDEVGARVALVGFGTAQPGSSLGGRGDQTPPGTRYAGFNVIDSADAKHSFLDLDSPERPELNLMGGTEPDSLEYFPLGGDSGGAALARVDEGWALVGIIGGVRFDLMHVSEHGWYGVEGRLERVSPHLEWIRAVLEGSS